MSDLAISALPIAGALSGSELIPLVQTGTTCQSTASALLTYISGSLTATNGLTKTGNNIVWGGALTGNTSISGSYTLNFANDFVGINTATQSGYSERLRVNGPTRFDDTVYVSDQGYFTWSPGTSFSVVATSQHLYLAAAGVKDIVFLNNGGESARIFSDNNVSIGYGVSASAKLQVAGSTTDSSAYAFKVFDSALSQIIGVRNDGYTYFSRLTASTVPYIDASNRLVSSAVTPTELALLSGITGFTGTGTLLAKGTSPVFTTDITTPLIIGGSAVGSQLTLQGTSASGTSTVAAIVGNVGNNGATNAFNVYNSGQFNIGNYASPTNLRIFTVGQDTAYMSFGSVVGSTSYSAIYFNQGTPSGTNYTMAGDASSTFLNAATNLYHRIGATNMIAITSATQIFTPNSVSSGAATNFTFTGSANTGQTASTEINRLLLTTSSRQWATGAITTQREVYITSPTYSFVGTSTISSAYTLYVAAPTAGTNATITNNYALGVSGGAAFIDGNTMRIGQGSSQIGISFTGALSLSDFALWGTGTNTIINTPQTLTFRVGNVAQTTINSTTFNFSSTGTVSTGASTGFTFTAASNTGQTASTEINGFLYNSYTRTWANGGAATTITTQREHYIKTVTWATSGGGSLTVTDGYAFYIEAPTASGITITNNYALGLNGSLKINDAFNIVFDTTTGTKIGTATTQKIGFWNATPIVQPTTAVAASTFVANTSGIVDDTATFDGYTIGQVVKALRNTGLLA